MRNRIIVLYVWGPKHILSAMLLSRVFPGFTDFMNAKKFTICSPCKNWHDTTGACQFKGVILQNLQKPCKVKINTVLLLHFLTINQISKYWFKKKYNTYTEEDINRLISIHQKYRKTGKEYN